MRQYRPIIIEKRVISVILICLIILFASCARMEYFPPGHVQTGLASWYGPDFHGKETSSKEIYNMYDMTAAHKSLPFGTHVMVTNLENGKSVMVRINDRGPFVKGRIIDLSYSAARILDMVDQGVARVRIEVVEHLSPPKSSQLFSVQVGAFVFRENAEDLKRRLERDHEDVYITLFKTSNQTYYRVRIKAKSMDSANKIAQDLYKRGYAVIILEEI